MRTTHIVVVCELVVTSFFFCAVGVTVTGSLLSHHPLVRDTWINVASFMLFVVAIFFQIFGVSHDWPLELFGADIEHIRLTNVIWIFLLPYMVSWFRNRTPYFLPFLAL